MFDYNEFYFVGDDGFEFLSNFEPHICPECGHERNDCVCCGICGCIPCRCKEIEELDWQEAVEADEYCDKCGQHLSECICEEVI